MEPPLKRQRFAGHGNTDADLHRKRAQNDQRLKSIFESIFHKYEKSFDGIGDEIDLGTGEIVVDNGHIVGMTHEKDAGGGEDQASTSNPESEDSCSEGVSGSDDKTEDEGSEDMIFPDKAKGHHSIELSSQPNNRRFSEIDQPKSSAQQVEDEYDDELGIGGPQVVKSNEDPVVHKDLWRIPSQILAFDGTVHGDPTWSGPSLPKGTLKYRPFHRRMTLHLPVPTGRLSESTTEAISFSQRTSLWAIQPRKARRKRTSKISEESQPIRLQPGPESGNEAEGSAESRPREPDHEANSSSVILGNQCGNVFTMQSPNPVYVAKYGGSDALTQANTPLTPQRDDYPTNMSQPTIYGKSCSQTPCSEIEQGVQNIRSVREIPDSDSPPQSSSPHSQAMSRTSVQHKQFTPSSRKPAETNDELPFDKALSKLEIVSPRVNKQRSIVLALPPSTVPRSGTKMRTLEQDLLEAIFAKDESANVRFAQSSPYIEHGEALPVMKSPRQARLIMSPEYKAMPRPMERTRPNARPVIAPKGAETAETETTIPHVRAGARVLAEECRIERVESKHSQGREVPDAQPSQNFHHSGLVLNDIANLNAKAQKGCKIRNKAVSPKGGQNRPVLTPSQGSLQSHANLGRDTSSASKKEVLVTRRTLRSGKRAGNNEQLLATPARTAEDISIYSFSDMCDISDDDLGVKKVIRKPVTPVKRSSTGPVAEYASCSQRTGGRRSIISSVKAKDLDRPNLLTPKSATRIPLPAGFADCSDDDLSLCLSDMKPSRTPKQSASKAKLTSFLPLSMEACSDDELA